MQCICLSALGAVLCGPFKQGFTAAGRETEALVERLSQPEPGSSPIAFPSAFPQPLWRQYTIILTKNIISYWRCASHNALQVCTLPRCQSLRNRA